MSKFPVKVKNVLNNVINEMNQVSWMFVKNPKSDFTRNRTLSFSSMLKLIIAMDGQSIHKELYNFFGFKTTTPTSSAFVQRRDKIDLMAFEYLFHRFTSSFKSTRMMNGYELLAVDGSDIHAPTNPNDKDAYIQTSENAKGYNLYHINSLYNPLDKRYVDVVVQDVRLSNERDALCTMVDRAPTRQKAIVLADRGYESYNVMAHIEQKGWKYLIRVKNSKGIVAGLNLPDSNEFDIEVRLTLTRRQTKEIMTHREKYRTIMKNMRFDYLPEKSKDTYELKFRLVRIKVEDDVTETLITNLEKSDFTVEELKKMYKIRWGIETAFRELKYNIGLVSFHSKKADFILQEIYARLIMYNISMIIARRVCIQQDNKAYQYQINYAEAIYICKHFIRNKESPQNIEALIAQNILPIRPDRQYVRKTKPHSSVSFIYRIA